jgi:REP element-mobilizing transposase RayT
MDGITKRRRHLPHWTVDDATYFITFRLVHGELDAPARKIVLDHISAGDGKFYDLSGAVIMPDHGHALLRPLGKYELSQVTKGIKGVSARLLNQHWGRSGTVWQNESFDRIIRDQAEFAEKLQYMLDNPVKRGLVDDGWNWDGWYCKKIEIAP